MTRHSPNHIILRSFPGRVLLWGQDDKIIWFSYRLKRNMLGILSQPPALPLKDLKAYLFPLNLNFLCHSRHPEPCFLPGFRRIWEWQETFQFPKITMRPEILHKPRKRQDQNDKTRFLFRSFAFYRNKTKPFSSSWAAPETLPAKDPGKAVSLFVAQTIPCPVAIFKKAPETRCFLKLNSALIDL